MLQYMYIPTDITGKLATGSKFTTITATEFINPVNQALVKVHVININSNSFILQMHFGPVKLHVQAPHTTKCLDKVKFSLLPTVPIPHISTKSLYNLATLTVQVVMFHLRNKSLFNNTTKQASSCMKLFVWVLRKEPVLLKKVTKHAQKYVLKERKHWQCRLNKENKDNLCPLHFSSLRFQSC